jgi:hypothetical protein
MVLCDSQSYANFTHICPPDTDDNIFDHADPIVSCFTPSQFFFPLPPIVQIGGCTNTESDFDGVSYLRSWPGTLKDERGEERELGNYDRVAFAAHLPPIAFATSPA